MSINDSSLSTRPSLGYKGLIAGRIQIDGSTRVTFVNMHLPAGEGQNAERCKLWSKFLEVYKSTNAVDDYIFAFGDQNWRTMATLDIKNILPLIKKKEYSSLLNHDEVDIDAFEYSGDERRTRVVGRYALEPGSKNSCPMSGHLLRSAYRICSELQVCRGQR